MRPYRVLVLDDEEHWRKAEVSSLTGGGFKVDAAATPTEAEEFLKRNLYHLLILDISMAGGENDHGLQFLKKLHEQGRIQSTLVIVYSNFGNLERQREAFTTLGVIDFLEKQKIDNRALLAIVNEKLTRQLTINPALVIHWQGVKDAGEACLGLRVLGRKVKKEPGDPTYDRIGIELEDLLCRLFHDATGIVVRPMQRGKSGAGVLKIQPFYSGGAGSQVVVKFGEPGNIAREEDNYNQYVRRYLGGARSTRLEGYQSTTLLGGLAYSLVGTAGGEFEDFASFYHKNEISGIRGVLDNVFLGTCSSWYANHGNLQLQDLGTEYRTLLRFSAERLEEGRRGLKAVQGSDKIRFSSLSAERTFVNPILIAMEQSFLLPNYQVFTHGDLNANNILVDRAGDTWLIDFFHTGRGHVLRDFARLDAVLRLVLLEPQEATLDERYQMEASLLEAVRSEDLLRLSRHWNSPNPAVSKCTRAVLHLRSLAMDQIRLNPSADLNEYYIPLLFFSLNVIRFWDISSIQREHALLSAALLAERLA